MFGLALSSHLIQGPAVRTWNNITHFANLLWCKFNHTNNTIMPRSRRHYHSRSRTRSRSHSYDRDREVKRRRVDSDDSSSYRRSLSPEDAVEDLSYEATCNKSNNRGIKPILNKECKLMLVDCSNMVADTLGTMDPEEENQENSQIDSSTDTEAVKVNDTTDEMNTSSPTAHAISVTIRTRKRALTPNQRKKQLERQKSREAINAKRELKKQQLLEEKLKLKNEKEKDRIEKLKLKQEKEELKLKEKQEKKELKQKEMEEKQREKELKDEKRKKEHEEREQKRKEKEDKEEQKRKEKEDKEEQKRKELEEKQKEKQKQEEKKLKVAAMFANFFTKKSEPKKDSDEPVNTNFMPFKVKTDMRMAPLCRKTLTETEKSNLIMNLQNNNTNTYLEELKAGKVVGKSEKTWRFEVFEDDDVIIVEETNIGESIEAVPKTQMLRAKFLKFHLNRRPAYFGTWRKKSNIIKPRAPLALDKHFFDYELDSDDEWEEEDSGESLRGSDDEDKENEGENEYEVDNEFFVPHGHLSDDEINDEEVNVESPEAHKAKLKLLKKEFEEQMKGQTPRIKPRVLGCIWEKKFDTDLNIAIYDFLKPFAIISNGPVMIKKRKELAVQIPLRKSGLPGKSLSVELIPVFLKFIHGSTVKIKSLIDDFLNDLSNKGVAIDVSKSTLKNECKKFAEWMRYPEDGPMYNKFCWYVHRDVQEKYKLDLTTSVL